MEHRQDKEDFPWVLDHCGTAAMRFVSEAGEASGIRELCRLFVRPSPGRREESHGSGD
jgi:hypothetical protein